MTDNEMADADERARMQDEIERLSGELAQVREILGDRENDITRLTAALRDFAFADVEWVRNRARRALKGPDGDKD